MSWLSSAFKGVPLGGIGSALGGPLGGVLGGLLGSSLSGGGNKKKTGTVPGLEDYYNQYFGYALRNLPRQMGATDKAFSMLTGQNDRALYNRFSGTSDMSGQRNARALMDRGYGSGAAGSAILDSQNRRAEAGNDFLASILSPDAQASRYAAASGLYSGDISSLASLLGASSAKRAADAQYRASSPPTFLESLLGIAGNVLPYVLDNKR